MKIPKLSGCIMIGFLQGKLWQNSMRRSIIFMTWYRKKTAEKSKELGSFILTISETRPASTHISTGSITCYLSSRPRTISSDVFQPLRSRKATNKHPTIPHLSSISTLKMKGRRYSITTSTTKMRRLSRFHMRITFWWSETQKSDSDLERQQSTATLASIMGTTNRINWL